MARLGPIVFLLAVASSVSAFPKPGKSVFVLTPSGGEKARVGALVLSLQPGARIAFGGLCSDSEDREDVRFTLSYRVLTSACARQLNVSPVSLAGPLNTSLPLNVTPWMTIPNIGCSLVTIHPGKLPQSPAWQKVCRGNNTIKPSSKVKVKMPSPNGLRTTTACVARQKAVYAIVVRVDEKADKPKPTTVVRLTVDMRNAWGYLSAVDRHSFVFYQCMVGVYVVYAVSWMVMMMLQFRDLLRLQFWIGGVIAMGMVEKAVFVTSYHTVNEYGSEGHSLILMAEAVSCAKRTLARLLIIIVSAGFGIVKPRLGAIRPYVLGVGGVFFALSLCESVQRSSYHSESVIPRSYLLLLLVLVFLDVGILMWTFNLLRETIVLLSLRRNLVKLALYNKFVAVLVATSLASATFLLLWAWKVSTLRCVANWPYLWLEHGFWHMLFSAVLLAIMVLWRPTANNARYAFSAIVDHKDEVEMQDECTGMADGVTLRPAKSSQAAPRRINSTAEDELRWVEENIPSSLTAGLINDDEDREQLNFETSKML